LLSRDSVAHALVGSTTPVPPWALSPPSEPSINVPALPAMLAEPLLLAPPDPAACAAEPPGVAAPAEVPGITVLSAPPAEQAQAKPTTNVAANMRVTLTVFPLQTANFAKT
jgi:hypothetical protein